MNRHNAPVFRKSMNGFNKEDVTSYIVNMSKRYSEAEASFKYEIDRLNYELTTKSKACEQLNIDLEKTVSEKEVELNHLREEISALKATIEEKNSEIDSLVKNLNQTTSQNKQNDPYASAIEDNEKALLFDSISAKTGDGIDQLLEECKKFAVESPFLFPEDITTDQPERQVMAEIIREKLLWCLEREVPHGTAVEITTFSERDNGIIDIDATIYCERASHKGIIIGKKGEMLKKISSMARTDCERFMGTKVYLTTWVKVKENWRDSDFLVRNFGYSE